MLIWLYRRVKYFYFNLYNNVTFVRILSSKRNQQWQVSKTSYGTAINSDL